MALSFGVTRTETFPSKSKQVVDFYNIHLHLDFKLNRSRKKRLKNELLPYQVSGGGNQSTLGRQDVGVLAELVCQRSGRHLHWVALVLLDGELKTHRHFNEVL